MHTFMNKLFSIELSVYFNMAIRNYSQKQQVHVLFSFKEDFNLFFFFY